MYSNRHLLDKYEKPIPKTWDELLATAKYIIENEKKERNDTIVGYNGLFASNY